ncbi:MAG TPA: T9SS type A sorting domain-containing protein, partial [Bacteroidetes bacterium]|nr:T9SS type A sorting domain-containing protein [Bacteroidota bacterium]
PVPLQDRLYIRLDLPVTGALSARIFDETGRLVHTVSWPDLVRGQQQLALPDLALPNGVYFLQLQGNGWRKTIRLLEQH